MSEYQLYTISFIASVTVFFLNSLYKTTGKKVKETWLTIGVYVISFALAVIWQGVALPPVPVCTPEDPSGCVSAWVDVITAVVKDIGGYVAFAALIYQALLKKVLEQYVPAFLRKVQRPRG